MVTSTYNDCPKDWPSLLPCYDAPLFLQRGFPSFYENGNLLIVNLLIGYVLWLVVSIAVVMLFSFIAKLLKNKSQKH